MIWVFFRIIQGLQHEKAPKMICELVSAVNTTYEEVSRGGESATCRLGHRTSIFLLKNCLTNVLPCVSSPFPEYPPRFQRYLDNF